MNNNPLSDTLRQLIPADWDNDIQPSYRQYDLTAAHCGEAVAYRDVVRVVRWRCKHEIGASSGD